MSRAVPAHGLWTAGTRRRPRPSCGSYGLDVCWCLHEEHQLTPWKGYWCSSTCDVSWSEDCTSWFRKWRMLSAWYSNPEFRMQGTELEGYSSNIVAPAHAGNMGFCRRSAENQSIAAFCRIVDEGQLSWHPSSLESAERARRGVAEVVAPPWPSIVPIKIIISPLTKEKDIITTEVQNVNS